MHKKKCWQCAELINIEALVCPHCRGKQGKPAPVPKPLSKESQRYILAGGLILFAVVVLASTFGEKKFESPQPVPVAATEPASGSTEPASYKVEILAMRRLKELMRDPDSIETRNVRVPQGAAFLCGEVNGANAFGGKAGFRRFLVGGASEMPAVIEGDGQMKQAEFDDAWRRLC